MAPGNHLTDAELVEVLRGPAYDSGVCRHAADRIEALKAEQAGGSEHLRPALNTCHDRIRLLEAERDRLNTERGRWREAHRLERECHDRTKAERDTLKADWDSISGTVWQDTLNENVQLRADLEAAQFVRDKIEHAKCRTALADMTAKRDTLFEDSTDQIRQLKADLAARDAQIAQFTERVKVLTRSESDLLPYADAVSWMQTEMDMALNRAKDAEAGLAARDARWKALKAFIAGNDSYYSVYIKMRSLEGGGEAQS